MTAPADCWGRGLARGVATACSPPSSAITRESSSTTGREQSTLRAATLNSRGPSSLRLLAYSDPRSNTLACRSGLRKPRNRNGGHRSGPQTPQRQLLPFITPHDRRLLPTQLPQTMAIAPETQERPNGQAVLSEPERAGAKIHLEVYSDNIWSVDIASMPAYILTWYTAADMRGFPARLPFLHAAFPPQPVLLPRLVRSPGSLPFNIRHRAHHADKSHLIRRHN